MRWNHFPLELPLPQRKSFKGTSDADYHHDIRSQMPDLQYRNVQTREVTTGGGAGQEFPPSEGWRALHAKCVDPPHRSPMFTSGVVAGDVSPSFSQTGSRDRLIGVDLQTQGEWIALCGSWMTLRAFDRRRGISSPPDRGQS